MSGHSRWSQIKRKKGKTDVQRGKLFSKILREITVAARAGGGDPKGNMRLKAAMETARAANMPADNIKRAIQKGTGELPGEQYEEITYEGYAPGGVAVLLNTLTDNKNRTGPEIRHIFEKQGGRMGTPGSVAWMFDRRGVIQVDAERIAEDDVLEVALDAGAIDVKRVEKTFEITTAPDEMEKVRQALESKGAPGDRGGRRHAAAVHRARGGQGRRGGAAADRGAGGAGRRSVRLLELRHPGRGPRRHLRRLIRCAAARPGGELAARDGRGPRARPTPASASSRPGAGVSRWWTPA